MWLPHSGTMWLLADDAAGHYHSTFRYDLLYDVWNKFGRPVDHLTVTTAAYQYNLRVMWDGIEPTFSLPHGYIFLDWIKPVIDPKTNLALVITGTGTGKSSLIVVAAPGEAAPWIPIRSIADDGPAPRTLLCEQHPDPTIHAPPAPCSPAISGSPRLAIRIPP
jgi:hypothetical protein